MEDVPGRGNSMCTGPQVPGSPVTLESVDAMFWSLLTVLMDEVPIVFLPMAVWHVTTA